MESFMDLSERTQAAQLDEELGPLLEMTPLLAQKRRSQIRIIFDRFVRNRVASIGWCFLALLFLFCFVGPWVSGHNDPISLHIKDYAQPPTWQYPFGTDDVGRDQLARAMFGGQVSLLVGMTSMLVALLVGVTVGAIAGYYGGWIDNLLMRVTDVMLAIPYLLLLFVLSAAFSDGSPRTVIILIALLSWPTTARLVRGEFLALKEREFVLASRTIGARPLRLMLRHILPNAVGPIIVNATLLVGINIITESVLSFFNFGLHPPNASWGNMVNKGQAVYDTEPWLVLIPAMLIFATVLSFNLVGDGLRDALDPHMTER
jgi:peptide/nickel transport system permease protein